MKSQNTRFDYNSKVNTPDAFFAAQWSLLSDALYNRRLCLPTSDKRRRRWPLHPIYSMVLEEIANPTDFKSIDKRAGGRAEVLDNIMVHGIAGTLRSLMVLRNREDDGFCEKELTALMLEVEHVLLNDNNHGEKIRRAVLKYELVGKPK